MKDITLVAIDFLSHDLTRYAIEHSLEHIDPREILIISDQDILPGARHIRHDPITNMPEYSALMLKGVAQHITTGHALYVQWDGIANDKSLWTDDFLNCDYVGAPWPWEPEGRNIGNGGFSLRSKRLLDACLDPRIQLEENEVAEDNVIGSINREFLENTHGIKFATTELAKRFSFELGAYQPSFGFHGLWNVFNLMEDEDMDYFVERIGYQGWNVYKWHHTLAAVIRRGRMDIYEYMLDKAIEHSPHLLQPLSEWLERDSKNPTTDPSMY